MGESSWDTSVALPARNATINGAPTSGGSSSDVTQKNLDYARRKIQVATYALDGDWAAVRRILDYMESER